MESPLLLKVDDAAHRLNISRAQIYRLMAAGELRSVSIGTARRVPAAALDEYVARLVEAAQVEA